jgi:methylated-DNA-[protein]-cysteine S-methyltransferase
MAGQGYTIFDTAVGRCGIAWSQAGIVGVQLPEVRELETRRRLLQQYPEAREWRPPEDVQMAIDGIVALLNGKPVDLSDIPLDTYDIPEFNCRVYEAIRRIPRGETRSYAEIAIHLYVSGAINAVANAVARNPFAIIVPCHRAITAPGQTSGFAGNAGIVTKSRLLSIEGARSGPATNLFDALLSVSSPRAQ